MEPCDICKLQDWLRNYHLANTDAFSLFNEFLEMGESMPLPFELDLLRSLTKSSPLRGSSSVVAMGTVEALN